MKIEAIFNSRTISQMSKDQSDLAEVVPVGDGQAASAVRKIYVRYLSLLPTLSDEDYNSQQQQKKSLLH